MSSDLPTLIWQSETSAAGTTAAGEPWAVQLITVSGLAGWNARVTFPDGTIETTNHLDREEAARTAEWALARAGVVQKPVELMLQELLLAAPA